MLYIIIIFFLLPIIFIAVTIKFIFYVIKKSNANQPLSVLNDEKNELFIKATENKSKLITWEINDLEKISNYVDYIYIKGITRKFNGFIHTLESDKIISFRRIDRGWLNNVTSRICAISSHSEFYFDQVNNETRIHFNGTYIGKLVNNSNLFNSENQQIGTIDRGQTNSPIYNVHLHQEKVAEIAKNTDRRIFVSNRFYKAPGDGRRFDFEKSRFEEQEVNNYQMVKLFKNLNEEEKQWISSLTIFETIYYGIDFMR